MITRRHSTYISIHPLRLVIHCSCSSSIIPITAFEKAQLKPFATIMRKGNQDMQSNEIWQVLTFLIAAENLTIPQDAIDQLLSADDIIDKASKHKDIILQNVITANPFDNDDIHDESSDYDYRIQKSRTPQKTDMHTYHALILIRFISHQVIILCLFIIVE